MRMSRLLEEKLLTYHLAVSPGVYRSQVRMLFDTGIAFPVLFRLEEESLAALGCSPPLIRAMKSIGRGEILGRAEEALYTLEKKGIRFLFFREKEWPKRLSSIPDPPVWLFFKGALPPEDRPSVSVIGSRDATTYGLRMTEFICDALTRQHVSIISGLAAGIDGTAHRACLASGGKSYAVLGTGVSVCYPKDHLDLFLQMAGGRGGVISEYPPQSGSKSWHFPDRNRLIAAFGDCLIVTEARSEQSGSMITVGHALDQGKDVFALPGRLTDPLSRGCNSLIKNGAFILTSPDDVLEQIGLLRTGVLPPKKKDASGLSGDEKMVYALIGEEPCSLDQLVRKTGLPVGKLMNLLLRLELDGYVRQPTANYYTAGTVMEKNPGPRPVT